MSEIQILGCPDFSTKYSECPKFERSGFGRSKICPIPKPFGYWTMTKIHTIPYRFWTAPKSELQSWATKLDCFKYEIFILYLKRPSLVECPESKRFCPVFCLILGHVSLPISALYCTVECQNPDCKY